MKPITLPLDMLAELILEQAPKPMAGRTKRLDGSWAEPRGLECRECRMLLGQLILMLDPQEELFHVELSDVAGWCRVWSPYWWRQSVERHQRQQAYSEEERRRRTWEQQQRDEIVNAIAASMCLDAKKDKELLDILAQRLLLQLRESPEMAKEICKRMYGYEIGDYVK